jgi:hypothetical protein
MAVRPRDLAYVSLPAHTRSGEGEELLAVMERELAWLAAEQGYALAGVYCDVRGRSDCGVYQVVEAVRRGDAVAVVVPDLEHLRHCGCLAGADLRTASRFLRAQQLAVDPRPGDGSSRAAARLHVTDPTRTPWGGQR